MKLLLLNPRYLSAEELKKRYSKYRGWIEEGNMYVHPFEPPLGLAGLVSYLSKHGQKAHLIDLQACDLVDAALASELQRQRPDLVGITSMTTTYPSALSLAHLVKATLPGVEIVMGGAHPTMMPEMVLKEQVVDYVVRGEGEKPLLSLVAGEPLANIDGICYKMDGRAVVRPKAVGLKTLSERPMPDYGSFPVEKYLEYNFRLRGIRGLSMLISRGCPYKCSFCAVEGVMSRNYRILEPTVAVDEMEALKSKFSISGIWFKDSIFNLKEDWVREFCEELIRRGLNMEWQINTRVDLISEAQLALMKRAGLKQVDIGIESGSQKTLDKLNKRTTLEQIRTAVKTARKHSLVSGFFMIGVPGENEADISSTFQFAKELALDRYSFSMFVPLPGCELYDELKSQGKIPLEPDFAKVHFADTQTSYCDLPIERLREVFAEINDFFCSPARQAAHP